MENFSCAECTVSFHFFMFYVLCFFAFMRYYIFVLEKTEWLLESFNAAVQRSRQVYVWIAGAHTNTLRVHFMNLWTKHNVIIDVCCIVVGNKNGAFTNNIFVSVKQTSEKQGGVLNDSDKNVVQGGSFYNFMRGYFDISRIIFRAKISLKLWPSIAH